MCLVGLTHFLENASQLVVRAGIARLECHCALQLGHSGIAMACQMQSFTEVVGGTCIRGIDLRCFFQEADRLLQLSGL